MAVSGGRTSTRASYAVSWYSGMALVCVIAVPLSMLWDEYAPLMMMAFMPVPIFFLTVLCVVAARKRTLLLSIAIATVIAEIGAAVAIGFSGDVAGWLLVLALLGCWPCWPSTSFGTDCANGIMRRAVRCWGRVMGALLFVRSFCLTTADGGTVRRDRPCAADRPRPPFPPLPDPRCRGSMPPTFPNHPSCPRDLGRTSIH